MLGSWEDRDVDAGCVVMKLAMPQVSGICESLGGYLGALAYAIKCLVS